MMVTNTWMNPNTEQEFCTALVSQLCQVLRGYNCVNVGLKLLESDQMDCRRAGVVQASLWARMSVIASMAPVASMAPMASMVAPTASMASMMASMDSVASMASMVVAPMAPMVSVAWVVLMSSRVRERESAVVWRASHSPYQALCFAFVQMPSWCSAINELAYRGATPREKDRSRSLRRVANIDGVRAGGCCKIGGERVEGLPCKIFEERVDGLSHKIIGKNDVEKVEEELVRNELMGPLRKEGLKTESQLLGVAQQLQAGELLLGKRLS